jgi:hypothetical protein
MTAVLNSPAGSALYHQRAQSVEPTLGRSSTTAASGSSDDEAGPLSGPNGG